MTTNNTCNRQPGSATDKWLVSIFYLPLATLLIYSAAKIDANMQPNALELFGQILMAMFFAGGAFFAAMYAFYKMSKLLSVVIILGAVIAILFGCFTLDMYTLCLWMYLMIMGCEQ
jgi:hypothetical protein